MEQKTEMLNPNSFYDESESYFEKPIVWKSDFEEKLIKPHHVIKKKKKFLKNVLDNLFIFR